MDGAGVGGGGARLGLDFIALTDHNTVSPLAEMAQLGGDGLLTMGGQELTTFGATPSAWAPTNGWIGGWIAMGWAWR
ncbi:MAG: hypothetical protein R2911_35070 [Caldilineaceae bacterium]